MSTYDDYTAAVLKFVVAKEKEIAFVNANKTPQHILWDKNVCGELEDSEAYTRSIDGKFYFTELLVNKLMHFAYLSGEARAMNDEKDPDVTERPLDELVERAKALLDLIESDFGQSSQGVRIEAIVCELQAMEQTVLWEVVGAIRHRLEM